MINHILYNGVSTIPIMRGYFERPHINDLLREAVEKPLVTVVAGAGYGKTQAVAAFLQSYPSRIMWLQLSPLDNLVSRLWDRLIYAISLMSSELTASLEEFGFPNTLFTFDRFLNILTAKMNPDKKYMLVLDDFHLIKEVEILHFIKNLVDARITNLSIILISRTNPDISITGLSSKECIETIGEDDLKFTKAEMQEYFIMQNAHIAEPMISNIYEYTDGWIIAIYLIGLALKKGEVYQSNLLSSLKIDIFSLIENEVFSQISNELRKFLITLSLVDNPPLKLAKELAGHNPRLISQMTRVSSFVRFDAFIGTYRMHHLFLEFLQEKQLELTPDEMRGAHLHAANWYAGNGYKIDAIIHYEKIGCFDEILRIMLTYRELDAKLAEFMLEILNKAPEDFYEKTPMANIIRGKCLFNIFNHKEAEALMCEMIRKSDALPSTEESRAILGEAYIILGLISFVTSFYTRNFEFRQLFKMADECLPSGSVIIDNHTHLSRGTYACMVMQSKERGLFEEIIEAMCDTMPYAARVMNGCGHGLEYLPMTEAAYFKREFKNAETYAHQAIYKSQEKGQYDIESMATFYLIRIHTAQGHYAKVMELLSQLKQQAEKQGTSDCYASMNIAEGWFYAMIGQPEKVVGWISGKTEDDNVIKVIPFAMHHLVRARCYVAERKFLELLAFLEQGNDPFGIKQFLIGAIEIKALQTVALYYSNQPQEALEMLQEAYELADPNGVIMPFIENGNYMRTVVHAAMRDKSCAIPKEWLENIYTKSATYAKKLADIVVENNSKSNIKSRQCPNLTKREHMVLMDLCQGLTREEIADDCNLSVNTVKSVLQTIYQKLGAVNSLEAVRIATLMNLV